MSYSRLDVWPSLPPLMYARPPARQLPFPLGEPGCALFELGRHALWHGLARLGLRAGDDVLVPAYHHGSEIETLVRAGLVCRFYEARHDLVPDEAELEQLLTPQTRALYVIHYLGLPQDAARWRRWCDQHGLLLIEDAAQAWLGSIDGRPLGTFGDLAFFCLYKTFGFPDGGALVTRSSSAAHDGARALRPGRLAWHHVAWIAQRSSLAARIASGFEHRGPYSPALDFALGDPKRGPSAATRFLLPRLDPQAAAFRRVHYRLLLDELRDLVPPPFQTLPDGTSPFAFPIAVDNKSGMLERLADKGIHALDFWCTPHPILDSDRFPCAAARRRRLVALPVHQELSPADVERVADAVRPRRRQAGQIRFERLDSLDEIRGEWSELARTTRNIFATWEWASTWWRHFGGGRPLTAAACRSANGRLVAILPLYRWVSRPIRVLRFIGHGPSDQLGPICAPEDSRIAARLLHCLLEERRREWDVFLGEQLPRDQRWGKLLHAHVVRRDGSPVLRAAGGWEDYLATRSVNLRQQVRRRERALAHAHQLQYRLGEDPDRLPEDMDTLFTLHAGRWDEQDSPFVGADRAFHRDFAARALERGWLRLWFLELDGHPRAAWYGFRFEGVEAYYQAGRDMAWENSSVGFVLLAHSIRAALEDGIREYRFLRGNEAFKYRFANQDPGLETLVITRGARGAAGLAAVLAKAGQSTVRRRLAG